MMVANSANLIITVKPASQRDTIPKNYKNLNYPPPPLEVITPLSIFSFH